MSSGCSCVKFAFWLLFSPVWWCPPDISGAWLSKLFFFFPAIFKCWVYFGSSLWKGTILIITIITHWLSYSQANVNSVATQLGTPACKCIYVICQICACCAISCFHNYIWTFFIPFPFKRKFYIKFEFYNDSFSDDCWVFFLWWWFFFSLLPWICLHSVV